MNILIFGTPLVAFILLKVDLLWFGIFCALIRYMCILSLLSIFEVKILKLIVIVIQRVYIVLGLFVY